MLSYYNYSLRLVRNTIIQHVEIVKYHSLTSVKLLLPTDRAEILDSWTLVNCTRQKRSGIMMGTKLDNKKGYIEICTYSSNEKNSYIVDK